MYKEINCKSNKNEVVVFIFETPTETLYTQKGGTSVNITVEVITEDTDIEQLMDHDTISSLFQIDTLEEFEQFLSV